MQIHIARTALSRALSVALLGVASSSAFAQAQPAQEQAQVQATQTQAPADKAQGSADAQAQTQDASGASEQVTELDRVVATGFRKSLEYSTQAKRDAVNVTDSVFAEDMGKFPDLNIAESLNRIPGVQLARDVNGEGLNVAIRGLGTSFTKTTLNGASIATASIGLNSQNQNREVDLNLFPTEFFTQLTVSKTPKASQLEGGVSGVVDMRTARPFDNPGQHLTYQLQSDYNEISEEYSPRGSLIGSWTNDDNTFGALVGVSVSRGKIGVEGFESVGWTNPGLTYTQCGLTPPAGTPATSQPAACNTTGGGNWRIPDTVPNNGSTTASGLVPGTVINRDFLLANNPGLSIDQISSALIPRLGRPVHMSGDRDRDAFIGSLEWRPSENAQFYLDTMYTEAHRTNDRIDINLIGRNGNIIPLDMQVDANNVVTSATFTNAQFFLEARPYIEDVKFWNVNPGGTFWFADDLKLDVQANIGRSWLFRESPTVLVNSPFTTVEYRNDGGDIPTWTTPIDLNDPNIGWTWAGGRVNINNEKRVTETRGGRADLQFGEDSSNIRVGIAFDEAERRIQGFDNSAAWEDVSCRGLNADGSVPTPRPGCVGGPLAAIQQPELASYLRPGPFGFITVDFDRFKNDTNYYALRDNAPESGSANTAATTGGISERNLGAYIEANGEAEVWNRPLRFNAGIRYVGTDQETSGPVQVGAIRETRTLNSNYDELLPSMNLAWNATDDIVLRLSGSRTLTR
ncbi:MAG TPA: TonB-dependent receptor, partial [Lysobacter sp.]